MKANPFLSEAPGYAAISRRTFLARLTALSAFAALPLAQRIQANIAVPTKEEPWITLSNVQEHLFPHTTDGPGAMDINAIGYLQMVMAGQAIEPASRNFITKGVGWLQEIAVQQEKAEFNHLKEAQKEAVLRAIVRTTAGENWLSTLLLYIFEALLSDPVYGSNPDGIGWQWLGHQPGLPRPLENKGIA